MSADQRIELLKQFTVYDTAVDIVSSWEAVMNFTYANEFSNFYFDRFPSLNTAGDDVTPDFTVFISENYGFIGEIKRTFPDERKAILSTLEALLKSFSVDIEKGYSSHRISRSRCETGFSANRKTARGFQQSHS